MRKIWLGALALTMLLGGQSFAQTPMSAITADPPADARHPASQASLLIPSHGVELDARLYTPSGEGPHPTLLMLDGLPGWHNMADVDMALRRAGWNVLTLHYRGMWGEPGGFSIRHSLEDAAAAIDYLRRPDIVAKYGIDTRRLVIAGHSMGGFCAAYVGRTDHKLAGVILLDAWNAGQIGDLFRKNPQQIDSLAKTMFGDNGNALSGATAQDLAREVQAATDWNYLDWTKDFAGRRMLVVGAQRANGAVSKAFADGVAKSDGSRLTTVIMPTDHSFSDHRIALTETILTWLDSVAPTSP